VPDSSETYVHRVGRTGRGKNKGKAISFCSADENDLLKVIESNLEKSIQRIDISKNDYKITLETSVEKAKDWQSLLKEIEVDEQNHKKKKKKSKR